MEEFPLWHPDQEPEGPVSFHGLVAASPSMLAVFRKIELYGPAHANVLITGETGTGKELVARALHRLSARRDGGFAALNCSSISEELFESELFGHERGAFTGAFKTKPGRIETADKGTLFLDEIGTMPMRHQAKLLRALEEGTIYRVGGEEEIQVDMRVIAATNDPLERRIQQGAFRADLFHRLAVLRIHLPSLRERLEDIPVLATHFLAALSRRYDRRVQGLTNEAVRVLQEHYWPGNVRELRNVLERVFVETRSEVIGRNAFLEWERERDRYSAGDWNAHLLDTRSETIVPPPPGIQPPYLLPAPHSSGGPGPHPDDLPILRVRATQERPPQKRPKKLDEETIREALAKTDGNMTRAAELLGCHKTTLYRAMDRLGLDPDDLRD